MGEDYGEGGVYGPDAFDRLIVLGLDLRRCDERCDERSDERSDDWRCENDWR